MKSYIKDINYVTKYLYFKSVERLFINDDNMKCYLSTKSAY